MELKLYNTMSRTKEDFVPIDAGNVRMYVCGPTVYDFAHIGNARPMIVFDVLFRLLRHRYGADHVTYVRNVTDVDDKINARALRDYPDMKPVEAIRHLTEITDRQFQADVAALNCLPPTVQPRATEHVAEMLAIIERLIAGGFAYAAEGHVLFHVPADADYGKLSRRSLDDMIAGARVDVAPYKRDPMDFVLWKPSTEDEPGWPSPWGRGRPGWHIECSAMSWRHLGEVFDIHGGGIDLVFPHHENEIAQSCCAFGTTAMANVWMHNGFLQVEGEKMSKSLGNFFTIRELLDDWPGEVLRLNMLYTHYRQPIDWTVQRLKEARSEVGQWVDRIYGSPAFDRFRMDLAGKKVRPLKEEVLKPLADDLNTWETITAVRDIYKASARSEELIYDLANSLHLLGLIKIDRLGALSTHSFGNASVFQLNANRTEIERAKVASANGDLPAIEKINQRIQNDGLVISVRVDGFVELNKLSADDREDDLQQKVDALVAARLAARKARDFKESDRIRDELAAMGIVLKDGKDPATGEPATTWEVKR